MSGPAFVDEDAVRQYINLNAAASSDYPTGLLGSNIRAAGAFLQRRTGRQFERITATRTFTTEGRTLVPIPGLATATSVIRNDTTLTADESYWLIADYQQTGLYTAIQFGAFRTRTDGPWYKSDPLWWDRNLDRYPHGRYGLTSLPNDLVITGTWGLLAADLPEDLLLAVKAGAAFLTLRPTALLSGASTTPDGMVYDLSNWPLEVQQFVADWKLGEQAVAVG